MTASTKEALERALADRQAAELTAERATTALLSARSAEEQARAAFFVSDTAAVRQALTDRRLDLERASQQHDDAVAAARAAQARLDAARVAHHRELIRLARERLAGWRSELHPEIVELVELFGRAHAVVDRIADRVVEGQRLADDAVRLAESIGDGHAARATIDRPSEDEARLLVRVALALHCERAGLLDVGAWLTAASRLEQPERFRHAESMLKQQEIDHEHEAA